MKITLKRLNSRGVAHHFLIALMAVTVVASFGAYKVFFSKAATSSVPRDSSVSITSAEGCSLAGRVYVSSNQPDTRCTPRCANSSAQYVTSGAHSYCTGYVNTEASLPSCNAYGRQYIDGLGCAKSCIYPNNTYFANGSSDYCALVCDGTHVKNVGECPPKNTTGTTDPNAAAQTAAAKTACDSAHKKWDDSKGGCTGTCMDGYVKDGIDCTTSSDIAKTQCDNAHHVWDASKSGCSTACISGYGPGGPYGTDCVSKNSATAATDAAKSNCDLSNHVWDTAKKSCQNACISGYTLKGSTCEQNKGQSAPTSTQQGTGGTQSGSGASASATAAATAAAKATCLSQHRKWDDTKNTCTNTCADGGYQGPINNVCSKVEETAATLSCPDKKPVVDGKCNGKAATQSCATGYSLNSANSECFRLVSDEPQTKEACDALHKTWTANGKKCAFPCIKNYTQVGVECKASSAPATQVCTDGSTPANNECADGSTAARKCDVGANLSGGVCVTLSVADAKKLCNNGQAPASNGKCADKSKAEIKCPKGTTLVDTACVGLPPTPAAVDPAPTKAIVKTDGTPKGDCKLLGREWVEGNKKGQKEGCSTESCKVKTDKLLRTETGRIYCKDVSEGTSFALPLSRTECANLHRQWIDSVSLCANHTDQNSRDKTITNAPECVAPYTVYYIRPGVNDECFKPSYVEHAQQAAQSLGKPFGVVIKSPSMVACEVNPHTHWADGACRDDRTAAPDGTSWDTYCPNKLNRKSEFSKCSNTCTPSTYSLSTAEDSYSNKKCTAVGSDDPLSNAGCSSDNDCAVAHVANKINIAGRTYTDAAIIKGIGKSTVKIDVVSGRWCGYISTENDLSPNVTLATIESVDPCQDITDRRVVFPHDGGYIYIRPSEQATNANR